MLKFRLLTATAVPLLGAGLLLTAGILQANGPGGQLTTVIAPTTPTTPTGAQQWMFSD